MNQLRIALVTLLSLGTLACESGELEVDDQITAITVDEIWSGPNADGDLLPDLIDNCPNTFNSDAFDSDGDGIGNACDADYNNDGAVSTADFGVFLPALGTSLGDASFNPIADHAPDESNTISILDYAVFLEYFNQSPPETNVARFDSVQDGDTHLMVVQERVNGEIRHGAVLRPVSRVERYANGKLDSFFFGRSKLTVNDDGTWTAQGGFFCFDTGLIDPRFYADNQLEFFSDCSSPDVIHISMHILPFEVEF